MHPSLHARSTPDKPAYVMAGSGEVVTYQQLDERSNQAAHFFRSQGLHAGDVVAVWMENNARYLEIAWATQRSGLYLVCISSKLMAHEVEYIVRDSGARVLISSLAMGDALQQVSTLLSDVKVLVVDVDWQTACGSYPTTPISDERTGTDMLYSSGTTGRPKGIKAPLPAEPIDAPTTLTKLVRALYGMNENDVYLSPAPLYHAAPLRWSMSLQQLGATVVVMEKFEPEFALELIERHRVTCAQFVPTHFVRMLRLPSSVRERFDLSSLRVVVHAAAPCPVHIKEQMMDWWGPIIYEYYAGTEGNGMTAISPQEWLRKKGSVGKAVFGTLKICTEAGDEVSCHTTGVVYFAGGREFEYHNAPEKTRDTRNQLGWSTLGDVGYMDEEGYLFLTDRQAFMIISGGVNIYPQEIENCLLKHPSVLDVAVIGAPDDEMGERVVAVVQTTDPAAATSSLARELIEFAREHLSHLKAPRQIDFTQELPRHPNGKLYKRLLRDAYWGRTQTSIVG